MQLTNDEGSAIGLAAGAAIPKSAQLKDIGRHFGFPEIWSGF